MNTSIQQAAANALARWLADRVPRYLELPTGYAADGTELFGLFVDDGTVNSSEAFISGDTTVSVSTRWPEPDVALPAMAITVLLAGQTKDEILQPRMVTSRNLSSTKLLTTWQVLERTQPLQLDLWARYDVVRDALIAAMDQVLNLGSLPGEYAGANLALDLADGWTGKAVFDFEGPRTQDGPNAVQVSEFRATYEGEARAVLYVTAATPKLARIRLQQALDSGSAETITLSASGVTRT
jgi:hypothetical protein